MIEACDQRRLVGYERMEFDIGWRIEHGADGEIDFASAQLSEAGFACDVVQSYVDMRILVRIALDEWRQQILDCRTAGRDVYRSVFDRFAQRGEIVVELIDGFHERPRQLEQALSIVSQFDSRSAAHEELGTQFLLKRFDLQRNRGLAERHLLCRFRNTLGARCETEAT